jgi:hypothetical protein
VAGGEELAEADVLPATAPALAGWDEARFLIAWHASKVFILGLKSRYKSKLAIQELRRRKWGLSVDETELKTLEAFGEACETTVVTYTTAP